MSKAAEEITARVKAQLEAGTVPWAKPWIGGAQGARNLSSKKPYRGLNVLLLAISPYAGTWWVTFKQAQALGGKVLPRPEALGKDDPWGTRLYFWMEYCPITKRDARQCKVPGHTRKDHPFIQKHFTVFNAETQCEGLEDKIPPRRVVERDNTNALDIGLSLVGKMWTYDIAGVIEGGDGAHYQPACDVLTMPHTAQFPRGEDYYWTALHELVHSTGHKDRLDRFKKPAPFGSPEYAQEELTAEMGAAMAAYELGFEPPIEQTAAYLKSWLKALDNDVNLITYAAQRAAKALDMLFKQGDDSE